MAGKRNINRLRKALRKNSNNVKKGANQVRKAAQGAATRTAVKRAASAASQAGRNVGRGYGASAGSRNRSASQNNSGVRNSRLRSSQQKNQQKKERATTKAVMQRYNRSAANKAQFRKELRENKNRNFLSDAQKKTLRNNKKDYDKGLGRFAEDFTKGVVKRYGGALISGATDVTNDTIDYLSKIIPGGQSLKIGTSAAKSLYDNTVGRADKGLSTKSLEEKLEKKGSKLQKSGQKKIDEIKEGKSAAAQWGIDLAAAASELGLDALLTRGRGTMGAMYARAYGAAKQSALDEGASEEQARNYGRAMGALEAATEKVGSVAKPLRALYGKGAADDVIESLIGKITAKATSRAGKNAAYHGGKTLAAAITEGLEEMVSEGLEPTIANAIYAEAVGTPHSTSAKDVLYAGSIGGALGGILGGGGQVMEYSQGKRVENIYGEGGIKDLAKAAKEVDEAGDAAKGAAINELVDQGEGIAAGQARELYNAVYNQEIKDLERANLVSRSADAIMQRENLISPIQVNRETGEVSLGSMTSRAFNEQKAAAQGIIDELAAEPDFQMPEMTVDQITSAVASIQTGLAGIDEVNLFTIGNPEARTIYTRVTGKELPDTNKATREMLYEEIGKNRVASARAETENVVDEIKGLIEQDAAMQYESAGQEAFAQAFSDVNVGNVAQVAESLETFDDFYRAGRNGIAYEDVISAANPVHANVTEEVRRAAWQAGQQDMVYAANIATEQQARVDEAARKNGSRGLKMTRRGRFISEISAENRASVTASQQAAFRTLARVFGIDIHLVDSLESGANGEYHDGAIYLSMENDRALEYIFAHEITHHMQSYAPEEYNKLKELIRSRWAQRGDIEDAIKTKMAQYARHDVKISHEEALDEIIADSTYEVLQDEEFIDEVVKTDRSIAQAILDAIKTVLRKLRLTIAGGDRFTPAQNEALLSELDLLKEFERLWVDGLARAAENRDAVGSMGSEVRQQAAQGLKPFGITRSEILENMKKVAEMSPVVELDGSGFKKQEGRSLSQAVMDYYGGKEFYVNNPTLGDVKVGKRGIKAGTQHKLYGSKIEGFKALREVIEDGYVINVSQDYKNDGTDRVILATPIEIDGKTYYMGAVVNRTKSNNIQNYYIHDVILEEKNNIPKDTDTDKRHGRVDVVSPYNILQQLNNINNLSEKDVISDEGRFSLKDTTEETRNLIAQHNLGADNLKKAFGLGGFPMPSIAITKGDVGHANFGEISLIFDKATIDPADNRNKVYGADAWTPTFPDIEYEINDKKASKIYAKANKAGHVPFLNPTDFHPSNMESRISNKGEQGLIEYYKDDYGLKEMYLVDIGETPVDYVQTTVREEMSDGERREGQWYLDNEPELCESLAKARVDENPMKWRKDNIEKLREAYKNYLVSEGLAEDAADEVANAATAYEVSKPLLNAEKIKNGKDVIERTENDFTATKEVIDKKINEEDYEKWFSELFSGIEKNSGVWNGKDPYTPSGNRRSFAATHYPVTLDNIVSAMLAQADSVRNAGSMFVGTKTIRAAATESFGSIEGIKAASGKLQNIDTEEYESLKESLDSRLSAVMSEIVSESGNSDNAFIDMDYLGYAIEEACSKPTADNIKKVLVKNGWHITDAQAQEINNIINEVADMPVNMFEAKPLRAVGFDEVRAAVVPDDIDSDIKSGLSERGVEVFEYENGNDADRIEKVNVAAEEKDVKFSLPDEADVIDYANEHETEFVDVPPVRDYEKDAIRVKQQTYGELLEQVEKLKRDRKRTKGRVLDERSVREEVNTVISTLMTYSESYTVNGGRRKTNLELVRDGVHAVSQIYTALKKGDVYEAVTTAELAAEDIVERLEIVNDEMFYEYKELRDYLRATRIVISDEDAANIPDFKEFKRQQAGRLRIVKQNGIPVDTVYAELSEKWPELFSGELTHPADRLLEMADVRESLEPYDVMLSAEETQQLIKQTAQDLLDIAARGKAYKSWADKKKEQYDERLRLVKARQKEALRDVRRNERERTERLLQEEREKWEGRVSREKERAEKKVQAEKDKAKKRRENEKMRRDHVKHFGDIERSVKELSRWLLRPSDGKYIPENAKVEIAHLLQQIDLQTKRSKALEEKYGKAQRTIQMDALKNRYEELTRADTDEAPLFYDDGTVLTLLSEATKNKIGGVPIDELTNQDLHAIDILLKSIRHNIRNRNKNFTESLKRNRTELGESVIAKAETTIERRGKNKVERGGWFGDLINAENMSPRELHEQMGAGMQDAFMAIREGFDKHIDNITEAREAFHGLFGKFGYKKKPGSKIEKWRTTRRAIKVELESGQTITMSRAQAMSLYCARKREQYITHITNGGIQLSDVDLASGVKRFFTGKKKIIDKNRYVLSLEDVDNIISKLTQEQKDIADALQNDILNGMCKRWGNEASMRINGYYKFTEENYFPIKSARDWLNVDLEGKTLPKSIANAGFTKQTVPNASNPVVIDDIFSVVADHVNEMSQYNALAAPILDYNRVLNYKNGEGASVRDAITRAWGKRYVNYAEQFIKDLNGNFSMEATNAIDRFAGKAMGMFKKASIAFNLRVAIQQPTALVRAAMYINPVYFAAKNHTPNFARKIARKDTMFQDMIKHCPVARWKAWGYTQVDMSHDIDDIMMNKEWSRGEVLNMLRAYGGLDNWTWSKIWGAVRAEVKHKHKDIEVDSQEFYRICNERMSEIVDHTQVVDSVLHRSQIMRSSSVFNKMSTPFMSEPTKTYNMFKSQLVLATELARDGHKARAAGKILKASQVYIYSAAATSAAAAIVDAFLRGKDVDDDDEPDGWWENFLNNLWGNVNPFSLLPFTKDIVSFASGWGSQNIAYDSIADFVHSINAIQDKLTGNSDKDWSEIIRSFAESLGYVTGKPVKNTLREIESFFKVFGIDVFAAEVGSEEEEEKESWFDSVIDKMRPDNGSWADNLLNKAGLNLTDEEQKEYDYNKKLDEIKSGVEGLTGFEREDAIWSKVMENYTTDIKSGDLSSISERRRLLKAMGGDVEKFDEQVEENIRKYYKKTIGFKEDSLKRAKYANYLINNFGYTESQISSELVAKSEAAAEFQLAACGDDEDALISTLAVLIDAGITYEDANALFVNRTDAIKAGDYSTGELAYPVGGGEVTSGFGYRSSESTGGVGSTYHQGLDIAVPMYSDVVAADGGKVSYVGYDGGYGVTVRIDHGNGRYTEYAHLNGYYVLKGESVEKGQVIAQSGSTGNSTGPHLHFGVKESGEYVDPMIYFR